MFFCAKRISTNVISSSINQMSYFLEDSENDESKESFSIFFGEFTTFYKLIGSPAISSRVRMPNAQTSIYQA